MARPLRIEFPGAWYHVMNRGAGRRRIFKKDHHYRALVSLLAEITERYCCEIHAYCLMGNHYHLMLRTPEGGLQRMMRHFNGIYTQYFNRTEKTDGPLFRGRYQAILVDAQSHWLALSRYIHRNPLEAGIVKRLDAWPWSSYPAYIGKAPVPEWLHTREVLDAIGKRRVSERYREYVCDAGMDALTRHYHNAAVGPILGSDGFRKKILKQVAVNTEVPDSRSQQFRPTLQDILTAVAGYYEVPEAALFTSTRGRGVHSPARSLAMYLCQQHCGMTLPQIALEFGLAGYASAGSTIRNIRNRLRDDAQLQADKNYILVGWPRAVTHPGLPQIRTCGIPASGSSDQHFVGQR